MHPKMIKKKKFTKKMLHRLNLFMQQNAPQERLIEQSAP